MSVWLALYAVVGLMLAETYLVGIRRLRREHELRTAHYVLTLTCWPIVLGFIVANIIKGKP